MQSEQRKKSGRDDLRKGARGQNDQETPCQDRIVLYSKFSEQLFQSFKQEEPDQICSLKNYYGCHERRDSQGKNKQPHSPEEAHLYGGRLCWSSRSGDGEKRSYLRYSLEVVATGLNVGLNLGCARK